MDGSAQLRQWMRSIPSERSLIPKLTGFGYSNEKSDRVDIKLPAEPAPKHNPISCPENQTDGHADQPPPKGWRTATPCQTRWTVGALNASV